LSNLLYLLINCLFSFKLCDFIVYRINFPLPTTGEFWFIHPGYDSTNLWFYAVQAITVDRWRAQLRTAEQAR